MVKRLTPIHVKEEGSPGDSCISLQCKGLLQTQPSQIFRGDIRFMQSKAIDIGLICPVQLQPHESFSCVAEVVRFSLLLGYDGRYSFHCTTPDSINAGAWEDRLIHLPHSKYCTYCPLDGWNGVSLSSKTKEYISPKIFPIGLDFFSQLHCSISIYNLQSTNKLIRQHEGRFCSRRLGCSLAACPLSPRGNVYDWFCLPRWLSGPG